MQSLLEAAAAILTSSERRVEVISQNLANIQTPAYKRQRTTFSAALNVLQAGATIEQSTDMAQGKLRETGGEYDIAISGDAQFQFRDGDRLFYSRQGALHRTADGTLVQSSGAILQQAGGGDLVLGNGAASIAPDGTMIQQGQPAARIGLFKGAADAVAAEGDTAIAAAVGELEPASGAIVRQGVVEASNVDVGEEMVTMTAAMRQAEGGARMVQLYDELMDRTITSLGRGGR